MPGDRDEAAAFGKTGERGCKVPKSGGRERPLDVRLSREGRIHQDDAGAQRRVEMIMDLLGSMAAEYTETALSVRSRRTVWEER